MAASIIALSSFFIQNFPHISWYPFWYLGNPYQFLIGPVVPILLSILSADLADQISNLYLGLIFVSFLIGAFGIYFFLRGWGVGKWQAALSGIFYLVFPAGVFLLSYQNGLNHIALGFLPYIFLLYRRFLENSHAKPAIFLSIAIAFVLLIDISILLPLVIGLMALFISQEVKKDLEDKAIGTILILALSVFLSTIWYTPRFWWVLFSNPSFGGAPLFNVATSIFKLLLNLVPIVLAVVVARLGKLKATGYLPFATLFFSSFLFLTVVRFVSDPDFVMDWVGFGLELQFGMAIIAGSLVLRFWRGFFGKFIIVGGFVIVLLFDCSIVGIKSFRPFNNVAMKQWSNEYQNRILSMLKSYVQENERVFLSGSSVFWLNSFLPVQQIRGGKDEGSIHPFWAHASYQIREGESDSLSADWLKALGVSYVLVHQQGSDEPFLDFKHPEKFSQLELVASQHGDRLYRVKEASIARIADRNILNIPKPESGADQKVLEDYSLTLKGPLLFFSGQPNEISIKGNLEDNEVVSLAITYDPRWRLTNGRATVLGDALGNMVIVSKSSESEEFRLVYQPFWYDWGIPILGSGIILVILLFSKKLFSVSLGLRDDNEDY